MVSLDQPPLVDHPAVEPVALFGFEPARLARPVGEVEEHEDADENGRDGFQDVQALPSLQAPQSVETQ